MTRKTVYPTALVGLLLFSLFFTACKDDNEITGSSEDARVRIAITDAPLDDPNVEAVFVTVADVKLDDKSLNAAGSTTFELSALTDGMTANLVDSEVEAASYQHLELVLDAATDADGNSPGCYVLTTDGTKVPLTLSNDGVIRAGSFSGLQATGESTTDLVVDFDLRKTLRRSEDANDYTFATGTRLSNGVRVVTREATGTVRGSIDRNGVTEGSVIVYAYAAGTFNAGETETDEDQQFLNAVTSTRVATDGSYQLSYLPAGDYQIILASYGDADNDGRAEYEGQLQLSLVGNLGLDLGRLSVGANATTTLDLRLTGILP